MSEPRSPVRDSSLRIVKAPGICGIHHAPGSRADIGALPRGAKGLLKLFQPILALMKYANNVDVLVDQLIDEQVGTKVPHWKRNLTVNPLWRSDWMIRCELSRIEHYLKILEARREQLIAARDARELDDTVLRDILEQMDTGQAFANSFGKRMVAPCQPTPHLI